MKAVFLMADTFRRDHVSCYGNHWIHTPNLQKLASCAAVFENAYLGSFPTIPNRRDLILGSGDRGVPFNRWKQIEHDEVTLAERLGEKKVPSMLVTDTANSVTDGRNVYKGYSAWAFNRGQEGDPCWLDANVGPAWPVSPDLIRYTPERWLQVLTNRAHRRAETDWFAPGTYELALQWLERNYKRENFLLWVETFDPHEPWDPPKWYEQLYDPDFKGRVFDAPTYGFRKSVGMTSRELKNLRARYSGECTMVDACVGRLLAALEQPGILSETMVVFTSDHGAYFDYPGDNGMICKAATLGADGRTMAGGQPNKQPLQHFPHFPGVARIPLILHLPGQTKQVRAKPIVQPWDLTPTVLESFGLLAPPEFVGQSLMPLARGESRRTRDVAVCGTNTMAQAINGEWLYAVWQGQRERCLYNLREDPAVKHNLAAGDPAMADRLHGEAMDRLRALGAEEELLAKYVRDR